MMFACRLAAGPSEVVVLSPHWEGQKFEVARAFSDWHQATYGEPCTVRWREVGGGTSLMLRFLKSEYATRPDGIGIDVLYGGGVDPFLELKEAGLLERFELPAEVRARIPDQLGGFPLCDPDGSWFGANLSGFGIISNLRVQKLMGLPHPTAWSDLADPRLRGWVSVGDPRQSGSILMMYEIILQAYGWEKGWAVLAGIMGNARSVLSSGFGPPREAALGEVASALAIDVYALSQVAYAGSDAMEFHLPAGATTINPDAVAILRRPPNPESARRFITFLMSDPGQRLLMLPRGAPGGAVRYSMNRMGVMPHLYQELAAVTPVKENPFEFHYAFRYDAERAAARRAVLQALIGACFIDLNESVRKTWKAIQSSPRRDTLTAEFCRAPVSEAEVDQLAAGPWKIAARRGELVNGWLTSTETRLVRLRREAVQP